MINERDAKKKQMRAIMRFISDTFRPHVLPRKTQNYARPK